MSTLPNQKYVTELAILLLTPPTPFLLSNLRAAQETLQQASAHKFTYYKPSTTSTTTTIISKIYLIGTWDSVSAHNTFLSSQENLDLLELLKGEIQVEGIEMWHVDIVTRGVYEPLGAMEVSGLVRCYLDEERSAGSAEKLKGLMILEEMGIKGGWRITENNEAGVEWDGLFLGRGDDFDIIANVVEERLSRTGRVEICKQELFDLDIKVN
ncbi:hypothetical protein GLAREA_07440 [Glarea lozoyensis ATCC 20868]|nr:uncharacterized protein GLAREA_07440 [Glarea lozoyensis ATCC 20868]EPE32307.1 hypothetical protein GLAREA_07440 [Glarea lozoyensis ATCC 20868]